MDEQDFRFLLAALEELKANGPTRRAGGICGQHAVQPYLRWLRETMPEWLEFSGERDYPVPCKGWAPYGAYMRFDDLWDRTTEYGQARYRLLDFLIDRAREELANCQTPMTAQALKALKESIVKWEATLVAAGAGRYKAITLGSKACPLCELYLDDRCKGCPVWTETGQRSCEGTPYTDVVDRLSVLHTGAYPSGVAKAVKAELDFLKSLLPTKER